MSFERRCTVLDRRVVHEAQLGGHAQLQATAQLGTQKARRAREPRLGARERLGVAQRGEEDLRVPEVRGDLDAGQGDHAHARVLELGAQEPRQLALNLVGHAAQSLRSGHADFRLT